MFRSLSRLSCRALGAVSLLALSSLSTHAASFTMLGETVRYDVPPGYCPTSNVAEAQEDLETMRKAMALQVKLVEMLVPCAELAKLKAGEVVLFSTWLQIQVLATDGVVRKTSMGRTPFVRAVGKSAARLDKESIFATINKRLKEADADVRLDGQKMDSLGADDDAVYFSVQQTVNHPAVGTAHLYGIAGATLANRLPVSVVSYQNLGKVSDRTAASRNLRFVLDSVLKN